jgi:hypothetical protein
VFGLDFVDKENDAHFSARQVRRDVWTDENLTEFSTRTGLLILATCQGVV